MELAEGPKIEFPNVGKLITYDSVRVAIAATVGKIIPKIKAKHWENIAQAMLDACIVEQGTDEMEWEGAARMYLHALPLRNRLHPVDRGPEAPGSAEADRARRQGLRLHVRLPDLREQDHVPNLSVKAVAGMLSALGAKSIRVRGVKFKDQCRWVLPVSEFDPEEYKPQNEGGRAMQQYI